MQNISPKKYKKKKNAKNAHSNCKNHTKNAINDILGITDILPGLSPIGYPR
jgi:hypothetical protein